MEEQEESIPLGRQICLIDEQRLNLVNTVLNQVSACACEDRVDTHDSITAHVEVPVSQVLYDGLHQVLQDGLDRDLGHESKSAPSYELV